MAFWSNWFKPKQVTAEAAAPTSVNEVGGQAVTQVESNQPTNPEAFVSPTTEQTSEVPTSPMTEDKATEKAA